MDTPLQVSRLLEHGSTVHGSAEVITWTAEGPRRTSYGEVGTWQPDLLTHYATTSVSRAMNVSPP